MMAPVVQPAPENKVTMPLDKNGGQDKTQTKAVNANSDKNNGAVADACNCGRALSKGGGEGGADRHRPWCHALPRALPLAKMVTTLMTTARPEAVSLLPQATARDCSKKAAVAKARVTLYRERSVMAAALDVCTGERTFGAIGRIQGTDAMREGPARQRYFVNRDVVLCIKRAKEEWKGNDKGTLKEEERDSVSSTAPSLLLLSPPALPPDLKF